MTADGETISDTRDFRPTDSLILLPGNPRQGDIGAISESLRRFGQQKPIVVNHDGVILAGNHTYQAAVALGWAEIWVYETDLEGFDQPGFALADNRLSDLATYDNRALLEILADQPTLDGLGFDSEDVETLKRLTETYGADAPLDPYSMWGGMPDYQSADRTTAYRTMIHFPTMQDADKFFQMIDRPKRRVLYWPDHDGHDGGTAVTEAWAEG